ncbi:MAG: hypothetical protein COB17_11455 [Sulfurimonas sp.]|nr:MAG: hypothetical protein COB17_11455 [Sulfurimonas sp.]
MKKLLGIAVAIVIFVVMATVHTVYGVMIDSMRESMENISKFQFVAMGLSKMIPLLLAIWFVKLSWKKITIEKEQKNKIS